METIEISARCKDCKHSEKKYAPLSDGLVYVCYYYPTARIVSENGFCDKAEVR